MTDEHATTDDASGRELALDVVMVSYRCRELIRGALQALGDNQPAVPMRVDVVDNNSRDGTVEMIRSEFPNLNVENTEGNPGFSVACNRGIRRGNGRYVLALNPDTRITPGALDKLIDLMEARPEIGMCGCRLINEDGVFEPAAKRNFPTVAGALGFFLGVGEKSRVSKRLSQYRAPEVAGGPVDAICGAFMLMRRSALDQIGLFDEGYWMYQEDLDLCYRFFEAGWTTWYEPSVTVSHFWGGSSGRNRPMRLNYAFHYGMYRFYRKHYAKDRRTALNIAVYGGIVAKCALSMARSLVKRRVSQMRSSATAEANTSASVENTQP